MTRTPAARISAFVVSYNRAAILGTCLRALWFADEVIVVDKSSIDGADVIAARYADRLERVPWTPTVEETRAFALGFCQFDWVLFLDDDECLSPEAVHFIRQEIRAPRADIYSLPLRHYVLGVHDERAYYWPERHIRLFRRGAVTFGTTVHAGIQTHSSNVIEVPSDGGVCIHHLSHPDVAGWIERTNRYTSRPDRARVETHDDDLIGFAHRRIDHWVQRSRDVAGDSYPAAAALLRATYDIADRLKVWEEARGLDGSASFQALCGKLDESHRTLRAQSGASTGNRLARLRRMLPRRRMHEHRLGQA
jgi:glycosyltransferase involved in cell wall biosynthesis